jgi:hypothetical protein
MRQSNSKGLEANIGAVLSSLVIAFVVGTLAMIYNSDKNSQVFQTKLTYINTTMTDLKKDINTLEQKIEAGVKDRWTRDDHRDYEIRIDQKFNKMDSRILRIEFQKTPSSEERNKTK